MKYPARFYAQALSSLIAEGRPKNQEEMIRNLVAVLKKHGDLKQLPEITRLVERQLATNEGGREVVLETARPIQNLKQKIQSLLKPHDVIYEQVNPGILAGLRVTIDGERQIDASLKSQLNKLFVSSAKH